MLFYFIFSRSNDTTLKAPGTPKGTRDFGPEVMQKRLFILNAIRCTFEKYGFQDIETPALENLSVLQGKYGEEGDQLIFKILNSGDFLHKRGEKIVNTTDLEKGEKHISGLISEKGLRYDLTVPFARYVAANYSDLPSPFKRFQIQPVWRADRPQKGRYREFYQCDADVVGTDSLFCEAEMLMMMSEVLEKIGINEYSILINSRKLLDEIVDFIRLENKTAFFTILDKLDKIGKEAVLKEFQDLNCDEEQISKISDLIEIKGSNQQVLHQLDSFLSEISFSQGVDEINKILELQQKLGGSDQHIKILPTLARGLGYYTGSIFEIKVNGVQIGSVSGGGRYDDLTGVFGLPNVSGVGFSFGVDRLYDVLEELNIFPQSISQSTELLICHFDSLCFEKGIEVLAQLRSKDIKVELYPESVKIKKQMQYADKKKIPYTIIIGDEELKLGKWQLRNMKSGDQELLNTEDIIQKIQNE